MDDQVRWYLLRTSAVGVMVAALGMVWPSPSDAVRISLFGALAMIGWVMFGVLWMVPPPGPTAVAGGVGQ
jgi:hypothetical protein